MVKYLDEKRFLLEIGSGRDDLKEKCLRGLTRRRWRPDLLGFEIAVEEIPILKELFKGEGIEVEASVVDLYRTTKERSSKTVFLIMSEIGHRVIEARFNHRFIDPAIQEVVEHYVDHYGCMVDLKLIKSLLHGIEKAGGKVEMDDDVSGHIGRFSIIENTDLDLLKFPLRPYQKIGAMFMALNQQAICADEMGLGKDQPLNARILTPDRWSTMGQMKVGQHVINAKGKASKVVKIYPQGIKDIYEVSFSDGSKARCGKEHIWAVQSTNHRFRGSGFQLKTLQEIMEAGIKYANGNNKFYIPIVEPISFKGHDVPIHPYFIGAYLGDGHSISSTLFTNPDKEIVGHMSRIIGDYVCRFNHVEDVTYRITHDPPKPGHRNPIVTILKGLELWGKRSWEKHIPTSYLFNSYDNRLELLRGLMDTDGTIMEDGTIQYSTSSSQLADDAKFLIQSIGGVARVSDKIPTYTYKGERREGRLHYTLTMNLPGDVVPFRLTRKKERMKKEKKYHPSRAIIDIEIVGAEETQCIKLDDDEGLYLTDDCIVTHNTIEMLSSCLWMKENDGVKRVLIIAPASLLYNWRSEIRKFTDEDTTLIDGTPIYRKSLYKDLANGTDHAFFVLINYEKIPIDFDRLKKIEWDAIVLDEGQKIKNKKAKQSKMVKKLGRLCDRRLVLTGTPLENHLEELYSLMEFVNGSIFGSYMNFKDFHYVMGGYRGQELIGYKNLEAANRRLKGAMIRRKKEEVAKDLPDKIIRNIEVPLTEYQQEVYGILHSMAKRVIKNKDLNRIGAVFSLMRMLCDDVELVKLSNSELVDEVLEREDLKSSSSKMAVLEEIVEQAMDSGKKIVIFTQWVKMAHIILERLESRLKTKILYVDGKVSKKNRQYQVWRLWGSENKDTDYYKSNPKDLDNYRILLTTDSLNYGQNLHCASLLINFEILFNPRKQDQRDARIHRIGADKADTKYIINFITVNTVEQRTLALQKEKNILFDKVVEYDVDVKTNLDLIREVIGEE